MHGASLLKQFYSRMLRFHPPRYLDEYGTELGAVFSLAADDAAGQGWSSLLSFGLREMRDMPSGIIREHIRERRKEKMGTGFGARFDFKPGSLQEILAASMPFLLLIVGLLLGRLTANLAGWLQAVITILLWIFVLMLLIAAIVKGFPRWSLPYAG